MTYQPTAAPIQRRGGLHVAVATAFVLVVCALVGLGPAVQPASAAAANQYEEAANGLEIDDSANFMARRKGTMYKYNPDGFLAATAWMVPDSLSLYADQQLLLIRDDRADGQRVGVHWRTADRTIRGLCVVSGGKSGTSKRSQKQLCILNVPEGKRVEYRLGTCDGSKVGCGGPRNWRKKIKNWSWNTGHQPPKSVNGWRDLPDDADSEYEHGDCTEDSDRDC